MPNQFDAHKEFFKVYEDTQIVTHFLGEKYVGVTIEEMYQHFKSRMIKEMDDELKSLMASEEEHF